MAYRMTTRQNLEDFASGAVLRSSPGFPAFPVRLAQEIFLRALPRVPRRPLTLWDPCCGSGYLATVLGLLNAESIGAVICSDIAPEAVGLAARNLRLLTVDGLAEREQELLTRAAEFDKPGHADAAAAARRLAARLAAGGDVAARAAVADALDPVSLTAALGTSTPDLVITDVPYGQQTAWVGPGPAGDAHRIGQLLDAVGAVLAPDAVVAVCAASRKVPLPEGRTALARIRLGNRAVVIVQAGVRP
jgi:23S rRNA (guanine2535-N1)-methyltransferase